MCFFLFFWEMVLARRLDHTSRWRELGWNVRPLDFNHVASSIYLFFCHGPGAYEESLPMENSDHLVVRTDQGLENHHQEISDLFLQYPLCYISIGGSTQKPSWSSKFYYTLLICSSWHPRVMREVGGEIQFVYSINFLQQPVGFPCKAI